MGEVPRTAPRKELCPHTKKNFYGPNKALVLECKHKATVTRMGVLLRGVDWRGQSSTRERNGLSATGRCCGRKAAGGGRWCHLGRGVGV